MLLTIDGVRWQEVFGGTDPELTDPSRRDPPESIAPNLHRLGKARGAFVGAPGHGVIAASGPEYVSLPGYTEIFTGVRAHGCLNNDCERTHLPTLLDRAHADGAKVVAFASWTKLALALTTNPGEFPVFCGPRALSKIEVANPPVTLSEQRSDADTANAALAYFQAEKPDVFYLGLGEPDEFAHHGDYEGYLRAIRRADDVLGRVLQLLDEQGERGARTHVVVLPDHGRSKWFHSHGGVAPEAARVWLVASGPKIKARGAVFSPRERRLHEVSSVLLTLADLRSPAHDDAPPPALGELFRGE